MSFLLPRIGINDNNVIVSRSEALDFLDYFDNCEVVQAVYNQVDTNLFLNGLSIVTNKKEEMNPVFMESFRGEWTPFAREAHEHLFALGYCVVKIDNEVYEADGKNYQSPSPILQHRDTYDLEIRTGKNGKPEYIVRMDNHPPDQIEPDPNIMIFVMPKRAPDSKTGKHKCLLRPLLPLYKNIRLLQMYNDMALQQRAHPPVFVEKENSAADTTNQPFIKNLYDIKNNVRLRQHEMAPSEIVELPKKKPRLQSQWESINKYYDKRIDFFTQSHEDNMVPIPQGFTLCSGGAPVAEPPVDMLPATDAYRDRVFALLGIPVTTAFVQLNSKNGASSAIDVDDADGAKLNKSLRGFQELVTHMLTEIFYRVFPSKERKFKIRIMIYSPLSITQALTLDNMNIISRKMTKRLAIQRTGLDEEDMFDGKNEHDRPAPGQNENMTDEMIRARVENIDAETKKHLADSKVKSAEATGIKEEGYHPPKAPSSGS